jgi:hypothetical protein
MLVPKPCKSPRVLIEHFSPFGIETPKREKEHTSVPRESLVAVILLVELRPYYYKYWLIASSILVAILLFFLGRFIYRLDTDARALADFIRRES